MTKRIEHQDQSRKAPSSKEQSSKGQSRANSSRPGVTQVARSASRAWLALYGVMALSLCWVLSDQMGLLTLIPLLRSLDAHGFALVVLLVIGALLGMTRARHALTALAVVCLSLWLVVCMTPLSVWIARPLVIKSAPVKADAVVVLGSGVQGDNDFSNVALARLLRGIELVQGHYAPRLILTEAADAQSATSGSYTVAAKGLIARLGLRCPIVTVSPVVVTHDEAVLVSRLARQRGWRKILLVTSPLHSRRGLLTFRKAGLDVISTPCQETGYDLENLTGGWDRLQAFASAMREIVGLRVYRARGWV